MNQTRKAVMKVFDDDVFTLLISNEDTTVSIATELQRNDFIETIVRVLIGEIEAAKSRVRIEYDDMKEQYHRGDWRAWGTKRQTEDRMSKMNGEVIGMETALSTLYRAIDASGDNE